LTAAEVQGGLQAFYDSSGTGHRSPRVSDVVLLGSGFETDVFAFSLAGEAASTEEARDLVLRIYAGEGAAEKSAREFGAMARLREAGYPVPRVLARASDRSPLGRPFLIMERIHGVSLGSSYWSAQEDRRRESEASLCRLMVDLHALDGSGILPDSPLASAEDPFAFIDQELSHLSTLLGRLERQQPPSLQAAVSWLISHRAAVPCERLVVIHGDFHPNNVLVRSDGLPIVIDWSNVRLADCRSDLAWMRLITRADARPDRGEAELRLYEQWAGTKVRMIEYFEVAACTRLLLSVLISLQFGAARQGMRPGAEALMRQGSDHLRSVAALLQARIGRKMPDVEDALTALLE
jgi:aminoglycoside phosphotransferase (APT) family kinase protein